MLKYHQWQNYLPALTTIISIFFIFRYFVNDVIYYFGVLLVVVGLTFWWLGKITLSDAFGILPAPKKLITHGIYSKFRNPIYIGLSLTVIGWSFLIRNKWVFIFAFFIVVSSVVRAYLEDKELMRKFGELYKEYKKRTWF